MRALRRLTRHTFTCGGKNPWRWRIKAKEASHVSTDQHCGCLFLAADAGEVRLAIVEAQRLTELVKPGPHA
jgi:hypothetical protein